jgi:hypothetical protein
MSQYRGFLCLAGGLLLAAASGTAAPLARRSIKVTLKVPDSGWEIAIQEVYRVKDELWVISRVTRRPGMAMQVISQVSDEVQVEAPALPVRHVVLGKTWGWENDEPYRFPAGIREVESSLKDGVQLWPGKD